MVKMSDIWFSYRRYVYFRYMFMYLGGYDQVACLQWIRACIFMYRNC